MLAKLRSRLTYANVMSTLAVFIALGGSSYAAFTISGSSIKNRSISGHKLRHNTLTGREIKESTLARVPRARDADRSRACEPRTSRSSARATRSRSPTSASSGTARAATPYGSAVLQCAQVGTPAGPGRRLPTHGELRAALTAVQLAAGGELTANVYPSSSDPGRLDDLYVTDQVGGVALTPDTAAGREGLPLRHRPIELTMTTTTARQEGQR